MNFNAQEFFLKKFVVCLEMSEHSAYLCPALGETGFRAASFRTIHSKFHNRQGPFV